jgi:hypothetical protein
MKGINTMTNETKQTKYVKEYWKNFNERYKTLTAEELIALYHVMRRDGEKLSNAFIHLRM